MQLIIQVASVLQDSVSWESAVKVTVVKQFQTNNSSEVVIEISPRACSVLKSANVTTVVQAFIVVFVCVYLSIEYVLCRFS